MHKHQPTHTNTHTLPFPRRVQCVGGAGQERRNNRETDKQQQNFTIPTKIFCRVQESMQEMGQQRRRRRRSERKKQEAEQRREERGEERLEHEKP